MVDVHIYIVLPTTSGTSSVRLTMVHVLSLDCCFVVIC